MKNKMSLFHEMKVAKKQPSHISLQIQVNKLHFTEKAIFRTFCIGT